MTKPQMHWRDEQALFQLLLIAWGAALFFWAVAAWELGWIKVP